MIRRRLNTAQLLLLLGSPIWFFSCINLQTVADYSETSVIGIQNFEQIDYSFLQHCLDRCTDEAIRKYEIKRIQDCDCSIFIEADSVTQVIYRSIEGYFEGLSKLSYNELTNYSTNGVMEALSSDELGPVKIDERTVNAFSSLSNLLLRASTDTYRRKKLELYIEQANEPIQVLIEKFGVIVGTSLKGELRFKRERLYGYYIEMKMNRTLLSDYEKGKATSDYYQALEAIQRKEKELEVFSKSINQIAQAHQVLYENRNKLSVKDISGLMIDYSSNIQDLISEFNKLND
ncbi:hypothetical protein LV84_02504 [Algoriphagus ratkowskyi]|uniref:Uncharacterized protein n=1 Tax=Algoriphagus ratkowskyi TaxID=57028 RepID=A0A2W7R8D0_9BACT|nr:hypothetical protein [Algoriphagus ratkowskyi]PZX55366.1 hypothetical protein LV84_02504 [Algoriphagus ratkowskyi]TXD79703.1 hypothetical protein ESW18_00810 [Algoriphagus ratkowskyi]